MKLTNEQLQLIDLIKQGKNVLVDACIGSGKTTAIQAVCEALPNKKILYLTYNRNLKLDAQYKINTINADVNNYHGFAYTIIKQTLGRGVEPGKQIKTFLDLKPSIPNYDLILIDEYQDIYEDLANFLMYIKDSLLKTNNNIQIVAVGDIDQKIYNFDRLDITDFVRKYLDTFEKLTFTTCFRLNKDYANRLGSIWNKEIHGTNKNCKVLEMSEDEVIDFLSKQKPKDILCLGRKGGQCTDILNVLETRYKNVFNKKSVYAEIKDKQTNIQYGKNVAVFTTYDSSKGLERDINVICDFTDKYWYARSEKPNTDYKILKNIFLVAASRGKKYNIFVKPSKRLENLLTDEDLSTPFETKLDFKVPFNPSNMFDFKYADDIEKVLKTIKIEKISTSISELSIKTNDELIDISPCIGIWQEADFFNNYNIDNVVLNTLYGIYMFDLSYAKKCYNDYLATTKTIEEKILYLTALETNQKRYKLQVNVPFLTDVQKMNIEHRLSSKFDGKEVVQQPASCNIDIELNKKVQTIQIRGFYDVLKDNSIYELKFKYDISKNDYLQLASYLFCTNIKFGYLWNIRTNELYKVSIPSNKKFINEVTKCITQQRKLKVLSYNIGV